MPSLSKQRGCAGRAFPGRATHHRLALWRRVRTELPQRKRGTKPSLHAPAICGPPRGRREAAKTLKKRIRKQDLSPHAPVQLCDPLARGMRSSSHPGALRSRRHFHDGDLYPRGRSIALLPLPGRSLISCTPKASHPKANSGFAHGPGLPNTEIFQLLRAESTVHDDVLARGMPPCAK
jgi:hypothetical protein